MKLEWKHPKVDESLLLKDVEYLVLKDGNRFLATFKGFDKNEDDFWWKSSNGQPTVLRVDGYCFIPCVPNYVDELGALAIKLGNAESEKLLGKKITNTGEAILTTKQKVELDQKIESLRKEIEHTYELFKLTNKTSND